MARVLADGEQKQYYDVVMENARFCFSANFSGAATQYNAEGNRNFTVVLDDPRTKMSKRWLDNESGQFMVAPITAEDLANDGWNVKIRQPKNEGDEPFKYTKIMVRFSDNPRMNPKIFLGVGGGKEVELDESTVHRLDQARIVYADIVFRTHYWTSQRDGSSGVNGYLKEGHFLIDQGAFGDKYQQVPDDGEM